MRLYGREKFHIEQIDAIECNTYEELCNKLDLLERCRIKEYNCYSYNGNGYNCEFGGTGRNKKAPGRAVCKYDDDLNLLDRYISLSEAGEMNNIDSSTIMAVCRHYYYRAGGYVWAYEGEQPLKPLTKSEIIEKRVTTMKNNPKPPKPPKEKKKYVSRALSPEQKKENKLKRLNWNGQRVFQYNAFGELINVYDDILDASEKIPISVTELKKNLNGENLSFKQTVLRYENDSFDCYPMSKHLQPVSVYDLQGNYINRFPSHADAEKFIGTSSGEIVKVIQRGGSVKGYLVAPYGQEINRKVYRMQRTYQMLDDNLCVVREFDSYKEISNTFGAVDCSKEIRNAILNNTKYQGYYWKFKEEYPINTEIRKEECDEQKNINNLGLV